MIICIIYFVKKILYNNYCSSHLKFGNGHHNQITFNLDKHVKNVIWENSYEHYMVQTHQILHQPPLTILKWNSTKHYTKVLFIVKVQTHQVSCQIQIHNFSANLPNILLHYNSDSQDVWWSHSNQPRRWQRRCCSSLNEGREQPLVQHPLYRNCNSRMKSTLRRVEKAKEWKEDRFDTKEGSKRGKWASTATYGGFVACDDDLAITLWNESIAPHNLDSPGTHKHRWRSVQSVTVAVIIEVWKSRFVGCQHLGSFEEESFGAGGITRTRAL